MRQLRRYSTLSRRRRYVIAAARIALAAIIVLAVSGVAAAMAGYVARQVWSSPTTVERVQRPAALSQEKARGKSSSPRPTEGSPPGLPELDVDVPVVAPSAPPTHPDLPTLRSAQEVTSSHAGAVAPPPQRSPETKRVVDSLASPELFPSGRIVTGGFAITPPPANPPIAPLPMPLVADEPRLAKTALEPGSRISVRADTVTQEATLLRQALASLRRDHNSRGALRLLDDYDRRFGHGALALEATSARAQALLQLGDNSRALDLLDRMPLSQDRNTGELRVTRGELRSLSGRCRDALLDFDDVLRASPGSGPAEVARALFGRASCRARVGDADGAEQDRQRYLKEFPQGPAARRLSSRP